MQKCTRLVKDKQMGIACNLWIARENSLILVFLAVVHLDGHILPVEKVGDIIVIPEELVQPLAPDTPLPTYIDQNPSPGPFRLGDRDIDVSSRVTRWIKRGDRHKHPSPPGLSLSGKRRESDHKEKNEKSSAKHRILLNYTMREMPPGSIVRRWYTNRKPPKQ